MAAHLAFAPQNGLRHYLKAMQYADQTFKGLYHWNLFDAAVLLALLRGDDRSGDLRRSPLHASATSISSTARTTIPIRRGASTNCRG